MCATTAATSTAWKGSYCDEGGRREGNGKRGVVVVGLEALKDGRA